MSDLDGPNLEIWNSLRKTRPKAINEFSTLPILLNGKPTGVMAAMSADSRPHLLVPVENNKHGTPPVKIELHGLSITENTLCLNNTQPLMLDASSNPSEEAMFTVVARELARAVIVQRRDPREAAEAMVKRWRHFWTANKRPLSFEEKLGLFAEVYLLNRILIPKLGPQIVSAWKGQQGERHDFQTKTWHIESKATSKLAPIFRIHGHDQLETPLGKTLLVFCFFGSQESGSSVTLEAEIDSVRSQLSGEYSALNHFEECLAESGWNKEESPLCLRVRGADFYLVDDSFPTLGIKELPKGVTKIDWELDISHIPATDQHVWENIIMR